MQLVPGMITVMVAAVTGFGVVAAADMAPRDSEEAAAQARRDMVDRQIIARGITDQEVIEAMLTVPRHRFVPDRLADDAYADSPLPIGDGQTISQPFIVAYMTQALDLKPDDRVLEIGTGSGYQAAILAEISAEVYTIEIIPDLADRARQILALLGYDTIHVRTGDGYQGWPEHAPFDAVIVTAAPEEIPPALIEQLREGGRMAIPVGSRNGIQSLLTAIKRGGELITLHMLDVRFVPMVHSEEAGTGSDEDSGAEGP